MTDRELVARFLATRDERAFGALYQQHTPYLWKLAMRLCQDASEAEEVVQETWVRSVRLLPRFVWGSALRTFLAGVLVNCQRELRRAQRRLASDGEAEEIASPSPPTLEGVDLERALGSLSDDQRTVLLLYDLEGYTHEEIGTMLDIPAGTSKSRLFAARRLMRERLADGRA